MRILFLSHGRDGEMDYQHDCVLHGLKECYGDDVVDWPRVDYMYEGYQGQPKLYGRGFTLACTLRDDSGCDRHDIDHRIRNRFFEAVVFGSVTREASKIRLVREHYAREDVILIDGEDYQHMLLGLRGVGIYFKRELAEGHPNVFPIHFAMPRSKVRTQPQFKNQFIATCDPRDRSTYVFENEKDYYADYARSLFAYTTSKGGWDSMRHQEIIGCGAIPWFLDITHCPSWTCTNLPKEELREALTMQEKQREYWETDEGRWMWTSMYRRIYTKWAPKSITSSLAAYILSVRSGEQEKARQTPA